jgi:osmoprotectant transport system ATP-binding protein
VQPNAQEPADESRAAEIRLEGVSKRYPDGTVAVAELDLVVPAGELVCLVGPSGCGKTTTMKMVNRLIEPTTGRIVLDGEDVTSVDPVELRRRMGYVIQQVGLFPHQSVLANVGTVPRLLGWDKRRQQDRAKELLELVGLDPAVFAGRYPSQLSGGQRQRVGVARALAADPPVLLMDEPFSAIDPIARARLQAEFLRVQAEVRKTILFVTHDIDEAVRLGDRIAVFRQGGHLEQYDTPATLLGSPASEFVADFVGADRGLRRLAVTCIDRTDLETPPSVLIDDEAGAALASLERQAPCARWAVVLDPSGTLHGWVGTDALGTVRTVRDATRRLEAEVPLDAPLKDALATMLAHDAGWVAVLDTSASGADRYCGVLTPNSVHAALRRSVDADADADADANSDQSGPDPVTAAAPA